MNIDLTAFEHRLVEVQGSEPPGIISDGMRKVLQGGKRIRPQLILTAPHSDHIARLLLDFAVAIELVHTSSLILDDLPCMDDAKLRRDKECLHLETSEAEATLVAFSLLARAFETLSNGAPEETQVRQILSRLLSRSLGGGGMAEGQALELRHTLGDTDEISRLKTASLFSVSTEGIGWILSRSPIEIKKLREFGLSVGLAFQALDDIQDEDGESIEILKSKMTAHLNNAKEQIQKLDVVFNEYHITLAKFAELSADLINKNGETE
jgi:geranylgeranyl diphosphate synthase, type II